MSLDVYLRYPADPTEQERAVELLRANGLSKVASRLEWQNDPERIPDVYWSNITHNLNKMASECPGLYEALWRPDECGINKAEQLIPVLKRGIEEMEADPERFKQHNPENKWGSYEVFLKWCREYLEACQEHPGAMVYASR